MIHQFLAKIKMLARNNYKIFHHLYTHRIKLLVIFAILAITILVFEVQKIRHSLPNLEKLANYEPAVPTTIFSQDGVKIAEIFEERRYPVLFNEMSPFVKKAFIASEDSDFYSHHGFDWKGFLRALFHYVTFSGQRQGGSTITQQLAKNVLLSKERTIIRKIKDIIVAREIEESFSKDKILELYLNTIFLGNSSYGIEAAAQNYFHKSNMDLTLAEAALIAGLAPAPSYYDPTENYSLAKARQAYVLDRMLKTDLITKKQYENALNEKILAFKSESPNNKIAPHFVAEVKKQILKHFEIENLEVSGLKIYTTLNSKIQNVAQNAVQSFIDQYQFKKSFKGALKHYGKSFQNKINEMIKLPIKESEYEKAIVISIDENLKAIGVIAQNGIGVILSEDISWALRNSSKNDSDDQKISQILKIGDEIHIQKLNKDIPLRILKNKKFIHNLTLYSNKFMTQISDKINRYTLTDSVGIEAAALVMDSKNGEVLAMVGGGNFLQSQFNRATQAERQVGSSVKPLYYSYAIDSGFSPASKIDSPKIDFDGWKPENYEGKVSGRTTLLQALSLSYNIPSVFLYQVLGASKVTKQLSRFGFNWPYSDLSLALGAGSSSLLKMVQAYSIFPNQGKMSLAYYLKEIIDRNGNILYSSSKDKIYANPINPSEPEEAPFLPGKIYYKPDDISDLQLISPQAAYVTLNMLKDVVTSGTGQGVQGISPYVGGKTGTTNGNTDAWFLGIASHLVAGVWVGYDDNSKSLGKGGTGAGMAAPIWKNIMQSAVRFIPQQNWLKPNGVHEINIDKETGVLSTELDSVPVYVIDGTEPGALYSKDAILDNLNNVDKHFMPNDNSENKIENLN